MDKPSWLFVNNKFICVQGGPRSGTTVANYPPNTVFPIENRIYRVVDFMYIGKPGASGYVGWWVIIEGCRNGSQLGFDIGWGLYRFKPLKTIEDDISLFKQALVPTLEKIE